jgi:hypothetical protein
MTTSEYLAALRALNLSPYGKATCEALGMSPRAIARMAAGGTVTTTVALLLRMYLRHGLPAAPSRERQWLSDGT